MDSPTTPVTEVVDGPTHQEIAERAYRRYEARGGFDGQDLDDWLQAERELHGERSQQTMPGEE
jgi:hypothetical protein